MTHSQKINDKAVLLLQMGGPSSLDEVESFLFNLFSDKYIIQLPWFLSPFQKIMAMMISKKRSPNIRKQYETIGLRSPIKKETAEQARALRAKLGLNHKVYFAMRYTSPFLKQTLKAIEKERIKELTVIPLYPQYSTATSKSSIIECQELFAKTGFDQKVKIKYIESWHDNDLFIQAVCKKIRTAVTEMEYLVPNHSIKKLKDSQTSINKPREETQQEIHILFSAHGLPKEYIDKGDPYQKQILESVRLILEKIPEFKENYSLSYQSKVGPVEWLSPATDATLIKLGQEGIKNLIIVPISFVGDHIETLYEIDVEYRHLAKKHGIENFICTEGLKDDPLLIEALASMV